MNPLISPDGKIQLYCGDALTVLAGFEEKTFDLILADPPYCSGGQFFGQRNQATTLKYQSSGTQKKYPEFLGDNMDQRAFGLWSKAWMSQSLRLVKPGGLAAVFTDWRQLPTTSDALQVSGWIWRGLAVWNKTEAARPQKGRFRNQCEYIVWGSNGQMINDGPCLPGVWTKAINAKHKYHVAGKPVEIISGLLDIAWRPGAVVLDPFMGSGTAGVACVEKGLSFVGIEKSEEYFEIAVERIEKTLNI